MSLSEKLLDKKGLTYLVSKIKTYVTNAVNTAKTAVGNYTINGKKLSTNPTIGKADVGLGNVDNVRQIPVSEKGSAGGVAELDDDGRVPSWQLPAYVDDILEISGFVSGVTVKNASAAKADSVVYRTDKKTLVARSGLEYYNNWSAEGADNADAYGTAGADGRVPYSGKIYVDTSSGKIYRWGGSSSGLVEISQGVALGETSSTAYPGDKGKAAYTHAVTNRGKAFASGLYKVTVNAEGHVTAATAVTKADITALGIPGENTNTTYGVVTSSANGLMSPAMLATLNSALQAGDIQFVTDAEIDAMWA